MIFQRYAMKITSKVIGSVNPETLCRSDGHLLFACGNEVVITGGENGQQLGPVFSVSTGIFFALLSNGDR